MPEEDTFAVLVKIMQDYRMREMFKPSMAELGLCMYQLDTLIQEHIPELYVHFQSQAIHTNLFASSWFLTLFATSLPLPITCRSNKHHSMSVLEKQQSYHLTEFQYILGCVGVKIEN